MFTLWTVKICTIFPLVDIHIMTCFQDLRVILGNLRKRRAAFLWENNWEIPAGTELSNCNHPAFPKCTTHAVCILEVLKINVWWGKKALGSLRWKFFLLDFCLWSLLFLETWNWDVVSKDISLRLRFSSFLMQEIQGDLYEVC